MTCSIIRFVITVTRIIIPAGFSESDFDNSAQFPNMLNGR